MESSTDVTIPETKILEINLISAQNLKIPSSAMKRRRTMHTYALAWFDPNAKLRSDLDVVGGENPTWNDKFIFRVSQDFLNGDTSAVQFQIYADGYLRDYFIGTVRYILSSSPKSGDVIGEPGFSALHIRKPSGNVHGVLNIAATVYNSSDFPSLSGVSAICFRDLIGKNHQFREGRLSRCLSHVGSKRSDQSSESESVYFSDGTDCSATTKTTSESSSTLCDNKTVTAFKDGNIVRSKLLMAGKKAWKSDGGSLLCGLIISPRRSKPLDQDQDQAQDQDLPSGKSKDDKMDGGD